MYANIGAMYLSWGSQLRDARLIAEAHTRYRRAVEWLGRCLEFGAGARLGEDTSAAQGATAREAAQKAGNELDLASAMAVVAAALTLKGEPEAAAACAKDAAARFWRLGLPDRATKIRFSRTSKRGAFRSPAGSTSIG